MSNQLEHIKYSLSSETGVTINQRLKQRKDSVTLQS